MKMRRREIPGFLYATLFISACATVGQSSGSARSTDAYLERLYFGRNIGDTATVSDTAWAKFKRDVIIPALPEGSTAWNAEGTWRAPNGVAVSERSIVLEFVHPASQNVESAVTRIIDEYKRRFAQEAVLRVVTNARMEFR